MIDFGMLRFIRQKMIKRRGGNSRLSVFSIIPFLRATPFREQTNILRLISPLLGLFQQYTSPPRSESPYIQKGGSYFPANREINRATVSSPGTTSKRTVRRAKLPQNLHRIVGDTLPPCLTILINKLVVVAASRLPYRRDEFSNSANVARQRGNK